VKRKRLKFEAFSLHGFVDNVPIDYAQLFDELENLTSEERTALVDGKLIAIAKLESVDGLYYFTIYSGIKEATILIYDTQTAQEHIGSLSEGQLIARKVHGVADPAKRFAWIEANRLGASAGQIAALIQEAASSTNNFAGLDFNLHPVVGDGFMEAVEHLGRIQNARLQISRPNANWTDFHDNLTSVADDSNAHVVELEARASRNQSLSKTNGLMRFLKQVMRAPHSPIKNAWVSGNPPGQAGITTLNLNRFVEAATFELPVERGAVAESEIRETLTGLVKPKTDADG
jgi:hypothetical protein